LDKYVVKLLSRAYRDLDGIYAYIAKTLLEPEVAKKLLEEMEDLTLPMPKGRGFLGD